MGNPDEDYFIELEFHAEGAKNISGWFSNGDCVLSVAWSARGSNQEPKTLYATLDGKGDYRFTISGYRGALIDLKVTLDASLNATGARLKPAVVPLILPYTSLHRLDPERQPIPDRCGI